MRNQGLSVVIPAYNEAKIIEFTVAQVYEFLRTHLKDFEIILVCDGSRDDTEEALLKIKGIRFELLQNYVNGGKGYAVKRGMELAHLDYVLFCDADLSTPLAEVEKFFGFLEKGYDIVIGSRAMPESRIIIPQPFLRRIMGRVFNFFVQILLFRGIRDTQCGFKIFRREVAKKVFSAQTINGFCFDAEILYLAQRMGFKIKEVGVEWSNRHASSVSIISDSLNMFADLFRIRFRALKRLYDRAK